MLYARIAVNVPILSGVFDYHLPEGLQDRLAPGHLVTIPFGKQTVQGIVLELLPAPSVAETRSILNLVDPLPVLTAPQLQLAGWMAGHFLSPLSGMLGAMLPTGLSRQADSVYELRLPQVATVQEPGKIEKRLLELLAEHGRLRGRQIDRHFKNIEWRRTAQGLIRRGLLTSQSILPAPSVRPKYIRTAQLSAAPEQVQAGMEQLGKTPSTKARRQAALRFLLREPQPVNVSWVYAESGCTLTDLQDLADHGWIMLRESEIWRDPLEGIENPEQEAKELILTSDQERAWARIVHALEFPGRDSAFLLHGVTGSGKTELYLRAAAHILQGGQQALILVPEISLTPQTVRRFMTRFPGQVGLLHSRLSEGERYDTWRRARLGLLKIIIGPRSALFAPLPKIGLIVIDECHDASYFQSEPPFYHAVSTAREYARLCHAVCILGSATPTVVERFEAEAGEKLQLLELPERIGERSLPAVQVVDMREELKTGNRSIFSRALTDALQGVLQHGQQAILFLNRRGTATYVFCRDCGNVLKCPNCDTPLTLHLDAAERLTCHRCGYSRRLPRLCPACRGEQIRAYGLGSEKVEAETAVLFPHARLLRWDWETTREKDAHEIILSHFAGHRADVLVGTQMLAKGLDLPLVTLVGIVLADVGLNFPDPFAAERTFALLTQVAGRTGRSELGGRVVLQTFQPDSYVIQSASRHDYSGFYRQEIEFRRSLGYPPFQRLVRIELRGQDAAKLEQEASSLAGRLWEALHHEQQNQTELIGPAPCYLAKVGGWYRWQIILRGPDPAAALQDLPLGAWRVEVDPVSLL
jgi:primosomal protein N' (replication factor Y)